MVLGRKEALGVAWVLQQASHLGALLLSISYPHIAIVPSKQKLKQSNKLLNGTIQQAIKWALEHNYNVVYVLSDCFNAIMRIGGMIECHYHDTFLIHNLREEIAKLSFCRISKVMRKVTQRAHLLAKHALVVFVPHSDTSGGYALH